MANPSVDEVLYQVQEAIADGLGSFPIESAANTVVPMAYRESFETRLERPDIWDKEGSAVLNAATQLGIIARAIASVRLKTIVDTETMVAAATIVENQCKIGFEEGKWCTHFIIDDGDTP